MTFNFKTFSTNMKDTFYTMEKYGDGRSKQEKVFTLLENIFMTNQRLESEITFFRYNNNGKYLAETNYLSTQINFIFPAQQPIQKKIVTATNKMCHMLRRKISGRPSRAMALPYLMQQGYS